MILRNIAWLLAGLLLLSACSSSDDLACTTEYIHYTIFAVDPNGVPVEGMDVTVLNADTEEELLLPSKEEDFFMPGEYLIMEDSFRKDFENQVVPIVARGSKGEQEFEAWFFFNADECHVLKVTGPDTVNVQ